MKVVDLHNHVFPQALIDRIAADPAGMMAVIEMRDGVRWVRHEQGYAYPLAQEFYDPQAKREVLSSGRIDMAAVSPAPPLFYYWAARDTGVSVARMTNDAVAAYAATMPASYRPVGTLPMPYVDDAVAELERIVREHGMRGIIVGTSIEGVSLADPVFRPILKRCAELGVWLLAHPYYVGNKAEFKDYYLTNLIGNPLDTLLCATQLMLGGVLDELPELQVVLAHGGGLLPSVFGRLTHGHRVRPETRADCATEPADLLRRFYYDTIVFDERPLRYLAELVGADRIVLGSDAPFDMREPDPRGAVERALAHDDQALQTVLGAGAASQLLRETFR